jgi:hypothetical protein
LLKERLTKIERWISNMQAAAQGTVDDDIIYLQKNKAKLILDADFYNYERKVLIQLISKIFYFLFKLIF